MARDHSIFAIARIGGHYHPVGVVHHSNLYDRFSPAVCLGLINVFSDESNRRPLEFELGLAADLYRNQGPPPSPEPCICTTRPRSAFPSLLPAYLILGAKAASPGTRYPPTNAYYNSNVYIPADGVDEGRTSVCIAVLDITELGEVRYGFTSLFRFSRLSNGVSADRSTLGVNTRWSGSYFAEHYHAIEDLSGLN